jgi:hypothetical protein
MVQGELLSRARVNPDFYPEHSSEDRGQSPSILGGTDYEEFAGRSRSTFSSRQHQKTRA